MSLPRPVRQMPSLWMEGTSTQLDRSIITCTPLLLRTTAPVRPIISCLYRPNVHKREDFSCNLYYIYLYFLLSCGHLLLRCCRGEEGHCLWHQRSSGEEILPHWVGEICGLEHPHRNSCVNGFDSVGRH